MDEKLTQGILSLAGYIRNQRRTGADIVDYIYRSAGKRLKKVRG